VTNLITLQVGDRVGYRAAFLRSTGQFTGPAPFARGTVIALNAVGPQATIAEIAWDTTHMPSRVHVANLATQREIELGY